MIVCKFGGTSVQNKEAIERVISIIKIRLDKKPVVVVSAFAKVTRTLCEIADEAEAQNEERTKELLSQLRHRHAEVAGGLLSENPILYNDTMQKVEALCLSLETFVSGVCQIGELSPRSKAKIISMGELLSSTIVNAAMNAKGIRSRWIDARRLIITDENYLNAVPNLEQTRANIQRVVAEEFKGMDIILTQGFIASSESGATSVLGFEGSDYSAAIFGMSICADCIEIWTDVDGIRTADPRVVENTKGIDNISYEEAAEMAFLGARVLHPSTIEPARKRNIPIRVLNSLNPNGSGSSVVIDRSIPDGIKSIAFRNDIVFLTITPIQNQNISSFLSLIFNAINKYKLKTILVSVTESLVSLTVEQDMNEIEKVINELSGVARITIFRDKAQISLVGKNVALQKCFIDQVKKTAGDIYMVSTGANMMNISFVIDRNKVTDVANSLHKIIF